MVKSLFITVTSLSIGFIAGQKFSSTNLSDSTATIELKNKADLLQPNKETKYAPMEQEKTKPAELQKNKKALTGEESRYKRTVQIDLNSTMAKLRAELNNAILTGTTEDQNEIFDQMEKLDSQHKEVYQAKVEFLQDDNKWDEAYNVLKDCVRDQPESVYCYRRLTNIRSSSMDDKIKYGKKCLEISRDDPICLVDLAIAHSQDRQYRKAAKLFDRALDNNTDSRGGFKAGYILFQQAKNFEAMGQANYAKKAYNESCKNNFKTACSK